MNDEFLLVPFLLAYGLAYLLLIGILWSPVGALIAYGLGRTSASHPVRYAVVAGVCSATFLFPWIALVMASRGRYFIADAALVFAFTAWLIGPLAMLFGYLLFGSWVPQTLLAGIVLLLGLGWLLSVIWAIWSRTRDAPQSGHLPAYRVIVPSAGLFFSEMVFLVIFVGNLYLID